MDRLHKILEERKKRVSGNHIYEERSKERLREIVKSKCETILIGALSSFETSFGELWAHGSKNKTEVQKQFLRIWRECRKDILDKGNGKIRDLEKELEEYSISWVRKTYTVETPPNPVEDKVSEYFRQHKGKKNEQDNI